MLNVLVWGGGFCRHTDVQEVNVRVKILNYSLIHFFSISAPSSSGHLENKDSICDF